MVSKPPTKLDHKPSWIKGLVLLTILAVLTGGGYTLPAQASQPGEAQAPVRQEVEPGGSLLPEPGASTQVPAAAAATPGLQYQTYNSTLFHSISSSTDWNYNFTYGTLHAVSPSTGGQFVLPLSLPDGVDIREINYNFRDNQAGADLAMGLCRVPLGGGAGGCLLWQVSATGVNSTEVVSRTLTIDPPLPVDNASYSYFFGVVLYAADAQHGIISARIGYSRSTYIPVVER